MKRSTILYVVIAVLVATNLYLLQMVRWHPPRHQMTKGTIEDVRKEFGFSEDQMKAFVQSKESHEKKIAKIDTILGKASGDYYLNPEGPNDSIMVELLKLSEGIYKINYQHFDEVRDLCDEDQKKTLINLITNLTSTQRQSKSMTPKKQRKAKR